MESFMGRTATLGSQRCKLPFLFLVFWNFTAPGLQNVVWLPGVTGRGGVPFCVLVGAARGRRSRAFGVWLDPSDQAAGSWDKSWLNLNRRSRCLRIVWNYAGTLMLTPAA